MAITTAGFRLEEDGLRKLKVLAAERGSTLSSIAQEALSQWWAQQPEAKIRGPLFPGAALVVATSLPVSPAAKEKP